MFILAVAEVLILSMELGAVEVLLVRLLLVEFALELQLQVNCRSYETIP